MSFGPPRGYYKKTFDFIKSEGGEYYVICPERNREHSKPHSIYEDIHWKFLQEKKAVLREDYVAAIPNGRVYGQQGDVIAPDDKLIWGASEEMATQPQCHHLLRNPWLSPPKRVDAVVAVLSAHKGGTFYHWFIDVLPRLYLIEKSGFSIDYFYVHKDNKLHLNTLLLFGVDKSQIITSRKRTHIQAKELIVPSLPRTLGNVPMWATNFLRRKLLPVAEKFDTVLPSRIYVDRVDVLRRTVTNRDEVVDVLEEYGFTSIRLERLSLPEQIGLMSQAEAVVAPHGAGLVNTVYCSPGTKVIEIFSPYYLNLCFWKLSQNLDLEYYYIIGSGYSPPYGIQPNYGWDEIEVDVLELEETLLQSGLHNK